MQILAPELNDRVLSDFLEMESNLIVTMHIQSVTGSLSVFNHRTNVDIENRIVCYDIKELGKQLKKLGLELLMPTMIKAAGITEQLKATDQMEWVGLMNTVKAQVEEIIFSELIYS